MTESNVPQPLTTDWFDTTHVVAIGIDDYTNGVPPLRKAVNDAVTVAEIVKELKPLEKVNYYFSLAYQNNPNNEVEERIKKFNAKIYSSTKGGFQELLSHLKKTVGNNDRIILYFAGHGIALPFSQVTEKGDRNTTSSPSQIKFDDKPQGYLLFQDAVYEHENEHRNEHRNTYMNMDELIISLHDIQCRHGLIILDCCFAGAIEWSLYRGITRQIGDDLVTPSILDRYIKKKAWQILTSSSENQVTNEVLNRESEQLKIDHRGSGKNSPFVIALRKAIIDGEADLTQPKRGFIHTTRLINYLREEVETKSIESNKLQTPCLFPFPLKHEQTAEFVFLLDGKKLEDIKKNLPQDPEIDEKHNPYLGLLSYSTDDSDIFFGRERLIDKLFDHVKQNKFPLTVVLGASGSGKSSLVKAGLIPKMFPKEQNSHQKHKGWVEFRPGVSPGNNLEKALEELKIDSIPQGEKRLLVIDQFEEVETQCQDKENKNKFLQELIKLIKENTDKIDVVLTLRSDFERTLCSRFESAFGEDKSQFQTETSNYWIDARFTVPTMEQEELEEVIEKPASIRVVFFEEKKDNGERTLVRQLSREVEGMPGALPLLSVALQSMYRNFARRYLESVRNGEPVKREITWEDYESLGGGVVAFLSKRANQVYYELGKENGAYHNTMLHVILRMISLQGNGLTRRQVLTDSELKYKDTEENNRVKTVIKRFSDARLIVEDSNSQGERYVEPAHDALVKEWGKLQDWFEERRNDLPFREEITRAAMNWDQRGKEVSYLFHRGEQVKDGDKQLNRAEELRQNDTGFFNKIEAEYIDECRKQRRLQATEQAESLSKTSLILFDSHQELDALVEAMRAGVITERENLQEASRSLTTNALRKIVYGIKEKNRLEKHQAPVISVSFSPNGEMFATSNTDETVILSSNGQEIKSLKGHALPVSSVAFSPDGRFIVTGSADTTVRLWSIESKDAIQTILGIDLWRNNLQAESSRQQEIRLDLNQILFLCFREPRFLSLINAFDLGEIQTQQSNLSDLKQIILSRLGELGTSRILSVLSELNLDVETILSWLGELGFSEEEIRSYLNGSLIGCVAFSPNGKFLAIANDHGYVYVCKFDSQTGKITLPASFSLRVSLDDNSYSRYVRSICFSPDEQFIATACRDKNIKVWKINENQISSQPFTSVENAHDKGIDSICFSPNGKFIVTASDDKTAKLWEFDGENIHQLKILEGHDGEVRSACFNSEGNIIATTSTDTTIKLWNLDGQEFLTLKGHNSWIQSAFFQPNSNVLAAASFDNTVRLWKIEKLQIQKIKVCEKQELEKKKKQEKKKQENEKYVHKISFYPNLNVLATVSKDHAVRLWKCERLGDERESSIQKTLNFLKKDRKINDVCFHNNGNIVATASYDGNIQIWGFNDDTIQNPPLQTLENRHISKDIKEADKYSVRCICFNPAGNILASTGNDSIIKLWNFDGQRVAEEPLKVLKNFILDNRTIFNCIRFSPDGKIIAAGSRNYTATLWNLNDYKPITLSGHKGWIRNISFNHDGTIIATASGDNTVKLWNLEGEELQTLRGHHHEINDVSFNHDGTIIATASDDKTVKLWNLEGQELQTLDYGDRVECVSFIPGRSSNTIISSSRDNLLILRELSTSLVEQSNAELGDLLDKGKEWIKDYSDLPGKSWIKSYLE